MSGEIARVAALVDALTDTLEAIGERVIVSALAEGVTTDKIGALRVGAPLKRDAAGECVGDISLDSTTAHIPARGGKACQRGYAMYASHGGSVAKLQGVGRGGPGGARGKRGAAMFSKDSRRRLLQLIGSIDKNGATPPLFVGLTYPGEWLDNPASWHQDMENFYDRLCRKYLWANLSIIWRMEPQQRGAPHFHLFIFGLEFLPWQWVAATWAELTNGNRASCCRVEKVRSWRGAMSYASKYLAKRGDDDAGDGFTTSTGTPLPEVGRHWGVMGRKHLPVTWARYALALGQFHWLRRQIARYMRSKGRAHRTRGRTSGLWCFMASEDVGRLLGAIAPYAPSTADTPRL
jgi:hypothetical protein